MRPPCSIDGCEKPSRGRGWCATHWSRWRKHGDPMTKLVNGVDWNTAKNAGPCTIEGCTTSILAKGLCSLHYGRIRRTGDPHRTLFGGRPLKGEHPTFTAIHRRLKRTRGGASEYSCVDCGQTAREWSYDNADPNELRGQVGRFVLRYSLDLSHYEPRCTSCHRKFDRKAAAA